MKYYKNTNRFGNYPIISKDRIEKIVNIIESKLEKGGKLLDYGCGDAYLKDILNNNIDYHGIDVELEGNKDYCKQISSDNLIPFEDKYFDVVYAGEVIEHLVDTDLFIKECHRVLKDNGSLIVTTPNLAWFLNRVFLMFGYQPYFTELCFSNKLHGRPNFMKKYEKTLNGMGHLRIFTNKGLIDFIEANNFKNEKIFQVPIRFNELIYPIDKIACYLNMGSNIISVSTKI